MYLRSGFRRPQDPIRPFLCTDALHLTDLLPETKRRPTPDVHALAALFGFDLARLATRLDDQRVRVPLEETY
jgi:predicted RNA polymerase sigma factor